MWKLILAGLCGLIVLFGGYRVVEALTPAQKRLGAELFDLKEPDSGPLSFSIFDTPPLKEVGNCVAVRARNEYFVVRAGESSINVFRTNSEKGTPLRWDQKNSVFCYARKPEVHFSVFGQPMDPKTEDKMVTVLSTVVNDKVEISR